MSDQATAGQVAVGYKFNPSGDEKVQKLKQLAAEMFDIVEGCVAADDGTVETARQRKMRDAALHEIVTAQMWAVKVATLNLGSPNKDPQVAKGEAVAADTADKLNPNPTS